MFFIQISFCLHRLYKIPGKCQRFSNKFLLFLGNVKDSAINFYCCGYLLHLCLMVAAFSGDLNQFLLDNYLDISIKNCSKYVLNVYRSFLCTLSLMCLESFMVKLFEIFPIEMYWNLCEIKNGFSPAHGNQLWCYLPQTDWTGLVANSIQDVVTSIAIWWWTSWWSYHSWDEISSQCKVKPTT